MPRTVTTPSEPRGDELPRPGDLIDGKYRVDEIIGKGGMGVVVAARHEVMDQEVAIKLLRDQEIAWESVTRFMREARASGKLRSAHVARVYDCGTLDSGAPYLVMERLVGHDLKVERSQRGVLPCGEAVDLLLQAMIGLAEAHAQGIIHRDLKPSNLFLADKPGGGSVVKVLDFGVAKLTAVERAQDDLTATAALLGSPRYMSPEQAARPREVDERSDVWSLAVILYELLTGVVPFDGDTLGEIIGKLLVEPVPPVHTIRSEVPPELSDVIDGCLQRDLAARPASLVELAHLLEPFASASGGDAVRQIETLLSDGIAPPPPPSRDPAAPTRLLSEQAAAPPPAS
ncbi:MAG: serine/threonine protein kinase, partial [Deltaproteobacteria bacterium]|nr:serine/threonine protein kinase [Deltaproteobacteria bacterium]MBW2535593.1 serine/threonine protein kinase [Deltaproteobacteria bacterium]